MMSFLSEVFSSFKPTKTEVISSEPNENSGESDIIQNKMSEVNGEVQPLKRSGNSPCHSITVGYTHKPPLLLIIYLGENI